MKRKTNHKKPRPSQNPNELWIWSDTTLFQLWKLIRQITTGGRKKKKIPVFYEVRFLSSPILYLSHSGISLLGLLIWHAWVVFILHFYVLENLIDIENFTRNSSLIQAWKTGFDQIQTWSSDYSMLPSQLNACFSLLSIYWGTLSRKCLPNHKSKPHSSPSSISRTHTILMTSY